MTNYLNAELANTLGNLIGRTTSCSINTRQTIPNIKFNENSNCISEQARDLIHLLKDLPGKVKNYYEEFNFYLGIDAIMECLRNTNAYIQNEKPWELKKTDIERLDYVLILSLESLRISGILLQPIVPKLSNHLLVKLGVPNDKRLWSNAEKFHWETFDLKENSRKLSGEKLVLFHKIKE